MRLIPATARFAYIDTPALYAVVSAVNEQWRTLAPDCPPLVADNFRSYEGLDAYPFSDYEESVVLVSASSSGGLAGRLATRGFPSGHIVHVLFHGRELGSLNIAVDLCHDARYNPEGYTADHEIYDLGACKMCDRGSVAIPLRGDQFDIQGPQPEPLLMRRNDAPGNLSGLMQRLAGTGVLTASSGPRQHWIDTAALMTAGGGLERLDFFIRRYILGGIKHCILADPDSRPVAECVMEVNGSQMTVHGREEIDRLGRSPDDPNPLLVVASVIGSGRTLLEISRDLRDVSRRAPIIYVVAFAKITSKEHRNGPCQVGRSGGAMAPCPV